MAFPPIRRAPKRRSTFRLLQSSPQGARPARTNKPPTLLFLKTNLSKSRSKTTKPLGLPSLSPSPRSVEPSRTPRSAARPEVEAPSKPLRNPCQSQSLCGAATPQTQNQPHPKDDKAPRLTTGATPTHRPKDANNAVPRNSAASADEGDIRAANAGVNRQSLGAAQRSSRSVMALRDRYPSNVSLS